MVVDAQNFKCNWKNITGENAWQFINAAWGI